MAGLEKMPGHPRLYRRGNTYYHRAAAPLDIVGTYGKREETFSLKTKDYAEAIRRVRRAAVEVDQKFTAHRDYLKTVPDAPLEALPPDQLRRVSEIYYQHLLEEDEESRIRGFEDPFKEKLLGDLIDWDAGTSPEDQEELLNRIERLPSRTFEDRVTENEHLTATTRATYARGGVDEFHAIEAEDILRWSSVNLELAPNSPSWRPLVRKLQEATLRAREAIAQRDQGLSLKLHQSLSAPLLTPPRPLCCRTSFNSERRKQNVSTAGL